MYLNYSSTWKSHWKKFPPQTPKEKIRYNFNNITEFSETKKTISQAGIQFHTFVLPNEKQLSLLLKGLSQIETNYYRWAKKISKSAFYFISEFNAKNTSKIKITSNVSIARHMDMFLGTVKNKLPKCVKYEKEHMTKDCLKDTLLKCANCQDEYTSNFSNYPRLQNYLDRRKLRNQKNRHSTIVIYIIIGIIINSTALYRPKKC